MEKRWICIGVVALLGVGALGYVGRDYAPMGRFGISYEAGAKAYVYDMGCFAQKIGYTQISQEDYKALVDIGRSIKYKAPSMAEESMILYGGGSYEVEIVDGDQVKGFSISCVPFRPEIRSLWISERDGLGAVFQGVHVSEETYEKYEAIMMKYLGEPKESR